MENNTRAMETNSLVNMLYSRTMSKPEIGKGATICGWTDRYAFFVTDVSPDGKTCVLERAVAKRVDSRGMCESQQYTYLHADDPVRIRLRFLWKRWRVAGGGPVNVIFGIMDEYYDFSF